MGLWVAGYGILRLAGIYSKGWLTRFDRLTRSCKVDARSQWELKPTWESAGIEGDLSDKLPLLQFVTLLWSNVLPDPVDFLARILEMRCGTGGIWVQL